MKFCKLFLFICLVAILGACEKNKISDPDELVITVNTEGWKNQYDYKVFIVIENNDSEAKYVEIKEGETLNIKRGNEISGEYFNMHIFYLSNIFDDMWNIYSFYDLPVGEEYFLQEYIEIDNDPQSSSSKSSSCNITFGNIPDFDVVTRSARYAAHCHTLNTLEVPCAVIGGNTFECGSMFYICLHKYRSAKYKLIEIPDQSEYEISLSDMNSEMTKYSILKEPVNAVSVKVTGHGSIGSVGLFSLSSDDIDIFAGDSIDIFIPDNIPSIESYTSLFKLNGDTYQTCAFGNDFVQTDYSFITTGIRIDEATDSPPVFSSTSRDFDILKINLRYDANGWNIFAKNCDTFYFPDIPQEVLSEFSETFSLEDLTQGYSAIYATVIKDSRLDDYYSAIDEIRDKTEMPEGNYQIQSERFVVIAEH